MRSPYTGWFRFMLSADNAGELWVSFNQSDVGMVSMILCKNFTTYVFVFDGLISRCIILSKPL